MPLTPDDKIKYKALYLQTAKPYVSQMQEIIHALQNGQEDEEKLETIHRSAHSLSSQSTMMEYASTAALSHVIELIFRGKKEKTLEVTPEIINETAKAIEQIKASVDAIESSDQELDLTKDTEALRGLTHIQE